MWTGPYAGPHVPGYLRIRNFFLPDLKISTSEIEFARPHVSDTFLDLLKYPGLLWKHWQRSMRRKAKFASCSAKREAGNEVAILNTVFTVKNWAQFFEGRLALTQG